jgi:hypothetical protein
MESGDRIVAGQNDGAMEGWSGGVVEYWRDGERLKAEG